MNKDEDHLKKLSTAHYWLGGIGCFFSFMPMIHVVIGWMAITAPEKFAGKGEPPPPFFGWLFLGMGLFFVLMGLACSIGMIISGKNLAKQKNYWLSFVVACVECMLMPFGTILGIFTILVLSRDSVKRIYGVEG